MSSSYTRTFHGLKSLQPWKHSQCTVSLDVRLRPVHEQCIRLISPSTSPECHTLVHWAHRLLFFGHWVEWQWTVWTQSFDVVIFFSSFFGLIGPLIVCFLFPYACLLLKCVSNIIFCVCHNLRVSSSFFMFEQLLYTIVHFFVSLILAFSASFHLLITFSIIILGVC